MVSIECFLYKAYGFNTVENLSLVMLWDFIYKARFTPEKYAASRFFGYLSHKLSWVQTLAPDLKSEFTSLANALIKSNATRYCYPDT